MRSSAIPLFASLAYAAATPAAAQSVGFVATLGTDTVQVERVTRVGNRVEGLLVVRMPLTMRVAYVLTLDANGRMAKYEQTVSNGDGSPLASGAGGSTMATVGDSIIRESGPPDKRVAVGAAAPGSAYPLGTVPVTTAFGIWEAAIAPLRGRSLDSRPTVDRVQSAGPRLVASKTPVLYSSVDSVEMDYFGQGRAGFKFDRDGRLVRSDWRNTTYAMIVARVANIDVESLASAWTALDKAGKPFGRLSTRDSVRATIGSASLTIDYTRPSRRGRVIWGELVPWDKVWRLGADMATQFRTDADLMIGGSVVPAGTYTLWMQPTPPSSQGPSLLVVSSLVNVFGTQYTQARDFARVPLTRSATAGSVEQLTIAVRDGQLVIEWGDARYSVPVVVK